jgi:hypothetical protein
MLLRVTLAALLASALINAASYKRLSDEPYLLIPTEYGAIKGDWNKDLGDTIGGVFGKDMTKLSRNFLRYNDVSTLTPH